MPNKKPTCSATFSTWDRDAQTMRDTGQPCTHDASWQIGARPACNSHLKVVLRAALELDDKVLVARVTT